jgi:hypothetical protein
MPVASPQGLSSAPLQLIPAMSMRSSALESWTLSLELLFAMTTAI